MYVIFNNRMWGAWDGQWEDYNGCQAKKMQAHAYDNACHRTHVHISLSWNGARGKTTFWTGRHVPDRLRPVPEEGSQVRAQVDARQPCRLPGAVALTAPLAGTDRAPPASSWEA